MKIEDVHCFLSEKYRPDRFQGRNSIRGFEDYSMSVARSHFDSLATKGWSVITHHSSATGQDIWFNSNLETISSPFARGESP